RPRGTVQRTSHRSSHPRHVTVLTDQTSQTHHQPTQATRPCEITGQQAVHQSTFQSASAGRSSCQCYRIGRSSDPSQPCRQHGPQVSTSDRNTCSGCPHEPATRPTQYDQKQHSSQHEQPSQQAQQTPVSQQAQPSPPQRECHPNENQNGT